MRAPLYFLYLHNVYVFFTFSIKIESISTFFKLWDNVLVPESHYFNVILVLNFFESLTTTSNITLKMYLFIIILLIKILLVSIILINANYYINII